MTNLTIDRDYLQHTLADLVRINSINPSLMPGGAGEKEIAAYVTQAMQQLGMAVAQHEPVPDRISVVGTLRGSGDGQVVDAQRSHRHRGRGAHVRSVLGRHP